MRKMDRALQFTHQLGINNGFVLRDLSLMAGYLFPGFNQPLMMTGALNKQAGTRLAETTKWWIDITEPDGLKRYGAGFTSTIYVRFIHALVRVHLKKSKNGMLTLGFVVSVSESKWVRIHAPCPR